ncbi:MAG: hypothetical protein M3440_04655 [Chloroflexota bacterium]|nr:hypothetical protein [Chloroflexota bacterium]
MPFPTTTGAVVADAVMGGGAFVAFNAVNAHIGVGNSAAIFSAAQTDLSGASKTRKPMNAGNPTRADNALTFASTFGTGDANYVWEEWGVFNAATLGQMLNRKVEALGTKTSAATWQLSVTVTFNV